MTYYERNHVSTTINRLFDTDIIETLVNMGIEEIRRIFHVDDHAATFSKSQPSEIHLGFAYPQSDPHLKNLTRTRPVTCRKARKKNRGRRRETLAPPRNRVRKALRRNHEKEEKAQTNPKSEGLFGVDSRSVEKVGSKELFGVKARFRFQPVRGDETVVSKGSRSGNGEERGQLPILVQI
ncbi:hypothetical protein V8G54_031464 [Vigna mungo]|uniref:Uncharacterized protein n=1 Tax=Vigna mungo TaxID=3915 RepID=A0AAQ3MK26_VIGMU